MAGLVCAVVGFAGCEADGVQQYEAIPDGGGQENAASDITVVCDTREDEPNLWSARTDSGKVTVRGDRITMENATVKVGGQGTEVHAATADFPSNRCMIWVDMDVRVLE